MSAIDRPGWQSQARALWVRADAMRQRRLFAEMRDLRRQAEIAETAGGPDGRLLSAIFGESTASPDPRLFAEGNGLANDEAMASKRRVLAERPPKRQSKAPAVPALVAPRNDRDSACVSLLREHGRPMRACDVPEDMRQAMSFACAAGVVLETRKGYAL